jgi:hypothetical protein
MQVSARFFCSLFLDFFDENRNFAAESLQFQTKKQQDL